MKISYILLTAAGILGGYILFLCVLKILPKRLQTDQMMQLAEDLNDAKQDALLPKTTGAERNESGLQILAEQRDTDLIKRT